jgi:hypothetical protein
MCLLTGNILISDAAWLAAPASWKGALETYRADLVDQAVIRWLGVKGVLAR